MYFHGVHVDVHVAVALNQLSASRGAYSYARKARAPATLRTLPPCMHMAEFRTLQGLS